MHNRSAVVKRHWIKVRAPLVAMRKVAAQPDKFVLSPSEQSLFSYAKAYYRGGGWWLVSGYAANGQDVLRVLDRMER